MPVLVFELLSDYMGENGNLLLNVGLLTNGTIPPKQKDMLDDIGAWVNRNAEAKYDSKPWKVYGDNLNSYLIDINSNLSETQLDVKNAVKNKEQFNERTISSPQYGHDEVRYTTRGDTLYVIVLNPAPGKIIISTLGKDAETKPGNIRSI